ncbi:glucuronate isomerase [Salinicoccus halodurans]|uniref:Uronate isomerase n=1 Tax=Salinicoccus halodurans TaxID=407035 RepID=A0A0F7HLU9_9STAP|nr:glucuronate isomerase [Salinicoccus halodurans]AKG75033.1 hypothetical protein AAT16_13075 [Salinicoccus halodurans]SFK64906.1 glucuronate isomerase [Salinicoccus halodurans]
MIDKDFLLTTDTAKWLFHDVAADMPIVDYHNHLNPRDNIIMATMAGNFQSGGVPGKVQFGTAWWFNDNYDGMMDQMKTLANAGAFKTFIGMLTDSRSMLSFTRHEYFRRILCELLGQWAEQGMIPDDRDLLKEYVEYICYNNAKYYFGLEN